MTRPNNPDLQKDNLKNTAGLYIHIPYCKRKCSYCNFHFSTNLTNKNSLLNALNKELINRREEAQNLLIKTIYFGGGTPSLLEPLELSVLLQTIYTHYQVAQNAEITLEANPDDIQALYLKELQTSGINRLSIGVQSFVDEQLSWMNRSHSASQSFQAIEAALHSGFTNISIDLMYGLPDGDLTNWSSNLDVISKYDIPHISCYSLTIEERTALSHRVLNKTLHLPDDSIVVEQMNMLLDFCEIHDYEAYEISNFAKSGYRSKHNSAYWDGATYFGFGPAAHSFDKTSRRWNIANNALYIQALEHDLPFFETEILSRKNQCNEYIMLQLRRIEGIDINQIRNQFSEFADEINKNIVKHLELNNLIKFKNYYFLSRQGKYIADNISADLFVT